MEIILLLTFLLMIVLLGGSFLQEGKICLIDEEQINAPITIKYNLKNVLYDWAVKLVMRGDFLLNTVTCSNAQKATETTLIQLQIHKFEG
ncbi:hypothetical protein [Falsiporphyromonas endometrii]|uniref:Uncharacterized protein n=1 Tax=Falsiporphyromonas endometrii TaxID=1387297 RepID=A0ABV9K7U5_9PORP